MLREAANGRKKHARRVLIYGAGSAGQLLVREILANAEWGLYPVAFLDDDVGKFKRRLMGIPICGGAHAVEDVLRRARAEEVVISTSAIEASREQHLREVCDRLKVPVRRFRLEITE